MTVKTGPAFPERIAVVDSHTEGEPTRVVVEGWPQPAGATMKERREDFLRSQDHLRQAVVCEPRGHEAVVGALLTPPEKAGSAAGVVFFNNASALWMCGHGLIGVVRTLEFLGRLSPGRVEIDTPAGTVGATLGTGGLVTIRNVPASCYARDVAVEVPGLGRVAGDIAWGGNWFFLAHVAGLPIDMGHLRDLLDATTRIKGALVAAGITGKDGGEIDHIELMGPPSRPDADGKNYVLCPGGAYDRSPCGTGTSAKMASLHARGDLRPGSLWRQESVTGSLFTGWLTEEGGALIPHIRGSAFITGKTTLYFDPADFFRGGIPTR